jgi:hypothetical protein
MTRMDWKRYIYIYIYIYQTEIRQARGLIGEPRADEEYDMKKAML